MKKLSLTALLFIVACSFTYAQQHEEHETEKSNLFIGGGFDFETSSLQKTSSTSFQLKPEVGYRLTERLVLGLGISYHINSQKNKGAVENKTRKSGYGLSVFSEYYTELTGGLEFFGFAEIGYNIMKSKSTNGNTTFKNPDVSTLEIGLGPGIAYSFNNHFELLFKWGLLGYEIESTSSSNSGNSATVKENTFRFRTDLSNLGLSLHYYF